MFLCGNLLVFYFRSCAGTHKSQLRPERLSHLGNCSKKFKVPRMQHQSTGIREGVWQLSFLFSMELSGCTEYISNSLILL